MRSRKASRSPVRNSKVKLDHVTAKVDSNRRHRSLSRNPPAQRKPSRPRRPYDWVEARVDHKRTKEKEKKGSRGRGRSRSREESSGRKLGFQTVIFFYVYYRTRVFTLAPYVVNMAPIWSICIVRQPWPLDDAMGRWQWCAITTLSELVYVLT